jgi:hypothetical protein
MKLTTRCRWSTGTAWIEEEELLLNGRRVSSCTICGKKHFVDIGKYEEDAE